MDDGARCVVLLGEHEECPHEDMVFINWEDRAHGTRLHSETVRDFLAEA